MDEKDALWVAGSVVCGAALACAGIGLWLIKAFHGKNGSL